MKKIDYSGEERVETGAVQFGDDYPGLFIRGDDAIRLKYIFDDILIHRRLSFLNSDVLCDLVKLIENEVRV